VFVLHPNYKEQNEMPIAGYTVHKLNNSTYALEEKTPMSQGLCYLLCGLEQALLIDTGFGLKSLPAIVRQLTNLPVIVANTHGHIDHIRGNHFFDEIWLHEADKAVFDLHTDLSYTSNLVKELVAFPLSVFIRKLLKPILTIDTSGDYNYFDDKVFHLGGRDIEVIAMPGHTPGSVCYLDKSNRMIFTGDSLCEWGVLLNLAHESCTPEVFLQSMQHIKEISETFDDILPGHHGFPVDKSYIDDYMICAERILEGTVEKVRDKGNLAAKYGKVLIMIPE